MRWFILCLVALMAPLAVATNVTIVWNNTFDIDPSSSDWAYGVRTDSSENSYVAVIAAGATSFYGFKFNASGDQVWNFSLDAGVSHGAYDVALDSLERPVFVGAYAGDLFVAKYTTAGTQLWNQTIDIGTSIGFEVELDDSDNIYVAGQTNATTFTLWRLNSTGSVNWTNFVNTGGPTVMADALDILDDKIYTVGTTTEDPVHTFVYYTNGSQIWNTTVNNSFLTSQGFEPRGISVDSMGGPVVATFTHNGDFYRSYLFKYDSEGNQEWNATDAIFGNHAYSAVDVDEDDYIYVGGFKSGNSPFFAKFNMSGDELWDQSVPLIGLLQNRPEGISVVNGKVFGVGRSSPTFPYFGGRIELITQTNNASLPASGLAAGMTLVSNESGNISEGTEYAQDIFVVLQNASGVRFAGLTLRFGQEMVNLSGLVLERNGTSVAIDTSSVSGIGATHSLYVDNTLSDGVHVCPDASTVSQVSRTCSNVVLFSHLDCLSGATKASGSDTLQCSIDGSQYVVSGLSGSGSGEGGSPEAIPEFSTIAMLVLLAGAILGVGALRRRQ